MSNIIVSSPTLFTTSSGAMYSFEPFGDIWAVIMITTTGSRIITVFDNCDRAESYFNEIYNKELGLRKNFWSDDDLGYNPSDY